MHFSVLLDAPAKPVSRIQIAKLGDFEDPRYGSFSITPENVANWQRNLSKLPGGEALIDFEHRSERKPRDSKAAGWISGIDLDGDKVMADARWTPDGQSSIENEIYRFLSPVFGPALGADNQPLDDALPSVALTNKPVLGLPAVCLASAERVSEAVDEDPALRFYQHALDGDHGDAVRALVMLDVPQAKRDRAKAAGHSLPDGSYPIETTKDLHDAATLAASGHGDVKAAKALIRRRAKELGVDVTTLPGFAPKQADSRPPMDTETLIKALELDEGADEAKILEAVTELKEQATKPAEPAKPAEPVKTLEQQAADEGKIVLDQAAVNQLKLDAAAGATAMKQLHQQRFEHAFDAALKDRKVTPAEKEDLERVYKLDADLGIKLMEDRQPIVPDKPAGAPTIDLDQDDATPSELAAAGVYPGSHELHRKIVKHMLENKLPERDYVKVLEQVQSKALVL